MHTTVCICINKLSIPEALDSTLRHVICKQVPGIAASFHYERYEMTIRMFTIRSLGKGDAVQIPSMPSSYPTHSVFRASL